MRRVAVVALSLSLLIMALPAPAPAQVYRYTDESGQNHYVDGLEKVPARHRASAVPLSMRNTPTSTAPPAAAGAQPAIAIQPKAGTSAAAP